MPHLSKIISKSFSLKKIVFKKSTASKSVLLVHAFRRRQFEFQGMDE
jgi:hypothetical protein